MDHYKTLLEMKQSAQRTIAVLENASIGASPEILSIIDKMLFVARNNIKIVDIAISCHQRVDGTLAHVA